MRGADLLKCRHPLLLIILCSEESLGALSHSHSWIASQSAFLSMFRAGWFPTLVHTNSRLWYNKSWHAKSPATAVPVMRVSLVAQDDCMLDSQPVFTRLSMHSCALLVFHCSKHTHH
mmetsp:Transcript_68479/g.193363  ORF Transcript_68479/g.193363 Transcript_68479/m.193363 type:complete len:117 (+) Transcript_68479:296-646(+)